MTYAIVQSYRYAGRGGPLALLAFLLLLFGAGEALAQGGNSRPEAGRPQSGAADKGSQTSSDMVIISNMPERKGPIYNLLKRLFCKNNGAVTGAANSEVWSVPQGQTSRVSKWLEGLGMKVTKLRDDWNHILKRHQGPVTAAQQGMLDKMKAAPGTMGVHVMEAPDAALTAFLMTNDLTYRPSVCLLYTSPSPRDS